jgi:hypothetical protein
VPEGSYRLRARVSSDSPGPIGQELERYFQGRGEVRTTAEGFEVEATLTGASAKDLNRALLSTLRRVEKRTRLRSEWTSEGITEKFFDYVPKGRIPAVRGKAD